ncbi:uncharacterized protein IWZ02DRAFT_269064 [Phyllosticta citriasiana]|uniref:uncharacterized protein n=1 Tax=Phyllosticta citriasiana TaxID=595635 RepID=UPI0030FD3148
MYVCDEEMWWLLFFFCFSFCCFGVHHPRKPTRTRLPSRPLQKALCMSHPDSWHFRSSVRQRNNVLCWLGRSLARSRNETDKVSHPPTMLPRPVPEFEARKQASRTTGGGGGGGGGDPTASQPDNQSAAFGTRRRKPSISADFQMETGGACNPPQRRRATQSQKLEKSSTGPIG